VVQDPRPINFRVYIEANDTVALLQYRDEVFKVFNSLTELGELIYENEIAKYRINCVVFDGPHEVIDIRSDYTQAFDIGLYCPKPDWLSYVPTQIKMTDLIGGLRFPITFPIRFAERGDGGRVEYTGQNSAPVLLDFRVASGGTTMSNPRIVNELGEFIEIEKTISSGEKILVNTEPDIPSIMHVDALGVETDIWDLQVYGSNFFQLHKGLNIFTFTAEGGSPEVYLTYSEHYAGV
jgi:hypothetical protein